MIFSPLQNYKLLSLVAYVVRGLNVKFLIYSVDESNIQLYDEYKRAYAEVLHRWRLLDARAQVTYILAFKIVMLFQF